MHGKSGKNLVLKVPPGTIVKNQLTDQVLVDMIEPNFEYVICKGGNGGLGMLGLKLRQILHLELQMMGKKVKP